MSSVQFYRDRLDEARRLVDEAQLDNVRERCLRSAEAWQLLSDRAERVESERATREAATRARQDDV